MNALFVIALVSTLQMALSCIPMHVDDDVSMPPTMPPTTTENCKGCVPPPVRQVNYLASCDTTPANNAPAEGVISVGMKAEGDKCVLEAKGCPIGFIFVVDNRQCTRSNPTLPLVAECVNGNFYNIIGKNRRLVDYFVSKCNKLQDPDDY